MATHDPFLAIETLRNHLTQPDTKIAFLFGAGTSCAVRVKTPASADGPDSERSLIPSVADLTEICQKEIKKLDPEGEAKRFAPALEIIQTEAKPANRSENIEDILSCVRRKLYAVGAADKLAGLNHADLVLLEKTIRTTIAEQVNPEKSNFPERLPQEDFAHWIGRMPRTDPIEIFTTNYDILLETALEAERVPTFDGFVGCNRPYFCHDSLSRTENAPGSAWTRLWKVHGSINWTIDTVRGHSRVVRTQPSPAGEMIMPSHHKYDESRKQPYTALLDRLGRTLERRDTILFVCGYSFSDEHINAIIFDALEAKQRPHVIALQYADPDDNSVLAQRAARHLNLMVLGDRHAFMSGKKGVWSVQSSVSPHIFEHAFDQDKPEADGMPQPATGKFKMGDFVNFAKFLASLTPEQ